MATSARRHGSARNSLALPLCIALGLLPASIPEAAAQGVAVEAEAEGVDGGRELYLEVHINGRETGLIAAFRQQADGSLLATAGELREIGLRAPGADDDETLVALADLPGVAFEYNEPRQAIHLTAPDSARDPHVVTLRGPDGGAPANLPEKAAWGAFANYTLVATGATEDWRDVLAFAGVSGSVDAHLSTPLGVLDHAVLGRLDSELAFEAKRLETTWTTFDVERMLTYHAGDTISGGLAWTRPVRLGGLQVQREFSLRPDLVTLPLPSFKGSAAVPTTVEVFTDNVRSFHGELEPGPFLITGLPVGTGASTTTVVLRDLLGREIAVDLPYYGSSRMLRQGTLDFSAEAGFPRLSFGTESFDYGSTLFGAASLRYGVSDRFTLEAHAEASARHGNAGVGGSFPLGSWGAASVALAGSHAAGATGGQGTIALEAVFLGITAFVRTQRTIGEYHDIASVSARQASTAGSLDNARPPKAVERIGLGVPLPFDPARLSFSYTRREAAAGDETRTASLSLSRPLPLGASLHISAIAVLGEDPDYSAFASISLPLSGRKRARTGARYREDGISGFAEVSSSERGRPGDLGWRLGTRQGVSPAYYGSASYRTQVALMQGTAQHGESGTRATATLDGAVVAGGGGVFLAPRIHDAYAIVDAGAAEVDVFRENRLVGRTGASGRLIVANIRALDDNRISIDPGALDADAHVPMADQVVTAYPRSGVLVDFQVDTETSAAIVAFVDEAGQPIALGASGRLDGRDEAFVVGHDGEAYLRDLAARNRAMITKRGGRTCAADFDFIDNGEAFIRIDAVPCLPG